MRTLIESGGTGQNGSYDTAPLASGYNLDAIDEDSFELDGFWPDISANVLLDDRVSFARIWGGILALSGRAVVPISDGASVSLTVVRTTHVDTAISPVTISDTDLMTSGGSPVREAPDDPAANLIKVNLREVMGRNDGDIQGSDIVARDAEGTERWTIDTYGIRRDDLKGAVAAWGAAIAATRDASEPYELDVVPWLGEEVGGVRVGDVVQLDLTHFAIWDRRSGEAGYSGPARVLGVQISPKTYAMTLTVLPSGAHSTLSLAPSAPVKSFTGTPPGVGDTITLDDSGDYYDLCVQFLAVGAYFKLWLYAPGSDHANQIGYAFNAVGLSGSDTQLTISAVYGAPSPAVGDYLTIPARANANSAQRQHLHTDSPGASWQ